MFQKRHYEFIARTLRNAYADAPSRSTVERRTIERLARRFADEFAKDNPNFDHAGFLEVAI